MALLSRFFGGAASTGAGFAMGHAASPALTPAVQELVNLAWQQYQTRPLDAGVLAAGVSQGQVDPTWAKNEATKVGIAPGLFDALVNIANTGPPLGLAYEAWRRGLLTDPEFDAALHRTGLEPQWNQPLRGLKQRLLDPTEIAKAVHRGIMRGAGLLVTSPPTNPGNVPIVPPSPLDPVAEAAGSGFDPEHLRILVGNSGLPPGSGQMLQLLNRGAITTDDFQRGVAESNLRNEWGPVLETLRRHILTPIQYANLHLRGWITQAQRDAGGALSGMTAADMQLLFEGQGRPLTVRQILIGVARGGVYNGPTNHIPQQYLDALSQGSLRPEWFNIAYAARYTYPGVFALRALAQDGTLTVAATEQILLYEGWEPTLAHTVAAKWGTSSAATTKGMTAADLAAEYEGLTMTKAQYVNGLKALGYNQADADEKVIVSDAKRQRQARNQLINKTRTQYTGWKIDNPTAVAGLRAAQLTAGLATQLLAFWDAERTVSVHTLTEAQVVKAYKKAIMDVVTATDRLTELGLAPADIQTRLAE